MGLFDKFKDFNESRKLSKAAKNLKLIKNPKAIKEARGAAIDYFVSLKNPDVAIPSLLCRFEYSLEHGINDTREKEACMKGILKHKQAAFPYIKKQLKESTHIAWPIKMLQELADDNVIIDSLLNALNYGDISFDQNAVDKNYDILCYLVDYTPLPEGAASKLMHFLDDPDERVRFACMEVLINLNDEKIKDRLEPFLSDDSAENRRIRAAVLDTFIKNNWRVKDPKKFENGLIVDDYFVTKKGKIERRVQLRST